MAKNSEIKCKVVAKNATNRKAKNTKSPPKQKDRKLRVLIVDDNEPFRESLMALFDYEGFKVEFSASVNSSIEVLRKKKFDVIVLDVQMPEHSGQEIRKDSGLVITNLLKKYVDINKSAVLVVFTGYPNVRDCFAAVDMGAYYLPKAALDVKRDLVDMSSELVTVCKQIINNRKQKPNTRIWMVDHHDELLNKFPGQALGVIYESVETGDVKTVTIGECKVVNAPSVKELKEMIIHNPVLRKAMPIIFEVWEKDKNR